MSIDFSCVKTICIIGLSSNKARAAYGVAEQMQKFGFRIIPVNPQGEEVLGEKGYKSISDIPSEIKIDVADYFLSSDKVFPLVKEALDKGISTIWLQKGVINDDAARLTKEYGAEIIMDKCIKGEYIKMIG